jgi:hypothetical protein
MGCLLAMIKLLGYYKKSGCFFDWVVLQLDVANAFNSMSRWVIFEKNNVIIGNIIQFILFVDAFYAFESFMFYSHCNREINVIVIPSTMELVKVIPWGGHYLF